MADYYVNLDISTSGAAGTVGDPLGYDEFPVYFVNNELGASNYFLSGSHHYDDIQYLNTQNAGNVVVESATATPARIRVTSTASENMRSVIRPDIGMSSLTLRRLVIECDNGSAYSQGMSAGGVIIENCVLISYNKPTFTGNFGPTPVTLKGSSFVNKGVKAYNIINASSAGSNTFIMDSCYLEGRADYAFACGGNVASSYFRNCAFYGNPDLISIQGPFSEIPDGGNNVGQGFDGNPLLPALPTQYVNIGHVNLMTYPDDLMVIAESVLIDTGNASLGLSVDLFGVDRGLNPNIGAVELVGEPGPEPVTCWKYTARYMGSNRMFVANGGGKYPSELKVPGNVDISTGRMIDEGQLIDPNEFRIIQ